MQRTRRPRTNHGEYGVEQFSTRWRPTRVWTCSQSADLMASERPANRPKGPEQYEAMLE